MGSVQGSEFRAQGSSLRAPNSGSVLRVRAQGSELRVRVQGSGLKAPGSRFRFPVRGPGAFKIISGAPVTLNVLLHTLSVVYVAEVDSRRGHLRELVSKTL